MQREKITNARMEIHVDRAFIERELSRINAQLGYLEGAMELIALMPERATEITDIALNYIKTMRAADQGVSKC